MSFLKINNDKLYIDQIPNAIYPIISSIGVLGDGKSTLLNIYCEWIYNKFKINNKPIMPFISQQSNDYVTNGIDFFEIKNQCLLLDCQGMLSKNTKYDNYISIISYLLSNIIILTVRQKLDLQVLNNLIGFFSFLIHIPNEYKRLDKPKLILRIKDFNNVKKLKLNPNYLNELLSNFLQKNNDQYDDIKETLKLTFDIYIIYTCTPIDNSMYENEDLDIYSNIFPYTNESFINACENIYNISKECLNYNNNLLKDEQILRNLINILLDKNEINFSKLNFYSNYIKKILLKYLDDKILIEPYIDKTILDKIDGSNNYCKLYNDRLLLLDDLKNDTYNLYFYFVSMNLKDDIFKESFDNLYIIIFLCKKNNIKKSKEIFKIFLEEKKNIILEYIENNDIDNYNKEIIDIFNFIKILDNNIFTEYNNLINFEYLEVTKLINQANTLNELHYSLIYNLIEKYNIQNQYFYKIDEFIDNINNNYFKLNNINFIIDNIKNNINNDIQNIINSNNKKYYVYTDNDHNYIIKDDKQLEFIYEELIIDDSYLNIIIKDSIHTKLNKTGFLNNTLNTDNFSYINFVKYKFNTIEESFLMTQIFYDDIFSNFMAWFLENTFEDNRDVYYKLIQNNNEYENVKFIHESFDNFDKYISKYRKLQFNQVINNKFYEFLLYYFPPKDYNLC